MAVCPDCRGVARRERGLLMGDERELLRQVREQNSRLQQLIELTARLLEHSKELLRRLGPGNGGPNDAGRRGRRET